MGNPRVQTHGMYSSLQRNRAEVFATTSFAALQADEGRRRVTKWSSEVECQ